MEAGMSTVLMGGRPVMLIVTTVPTGAIWPMTGITIWGTSAMMSLCLPVWIHFKGSGQCSEYGKIVNIIKVLQQETNRNLQMHLLLRRWPTTSSMKNKLVEKIGESMAEKGQWGTPEEEIFEPPA
jgi:hypothetical protein